MPTEHNSIPRHKTLAGGTPPYLHSALAQMRQEVVLLKNLRSPVTAMLMSVLVGLMFRVVNLWNWTFRMSSGATLRYGTWKREIERRRDGEGEREARTHFQLLASDGL